MQHYQILSALLTYPEPELVAALPELEAGLPVPMRARVASLLAHLAENDMITLQQEYVQTFDRTPTHSLHLFEHIHGESRDRGQAMVDLMEEYKKHGLEMCPDELPDYVPLFLEFLSQLDSDEAAARLLGDAVHVLAHIGCKLDANGSVYAGVFDVLESLSPVQAEELSEPPIKDMDEALETFGPGADGVEPLLKPAANGTQPINFYPQGTHRQARAAA